MFRRLLGQYTSYMQLILVGAPVVSLVIKQWSTAIVLFVLSLINAVTGLRQEGKAHDGRVERVCLLGLYRGPSWTSPGSSES